MSRKNIDINKIAVSNKVSLGENAFRLFIRYKEVKHQTSYIFPPKMNAYRRDFVKLNKDLF